MDSFYFQNTKHQPNIKHPVVILPVAQPKNKHFSRFFVQFAPKQKPTNHYKPKKTKN
jgi:hypothetical protein